MKRLWIFIFIIHFATGHNPLAELLRLPSLYAHFQEHRVETPDLSLLEFLKLHYADSEHHEADQKHENLPMHCHAVHAAFTFLIEDFSFFTFVKNNTPTFLLSQKMIFLFSNKLISNYLASILQPPQFFND